MTTETLAPDFKLKSKRDPEGGTGIMVCSAGRLPLGAFQVRARIDGLFHETVVEQTFVNAHDQPIEATYIFPLPDRAAVTGFRMTVGERVIEGELFERGAAREKYDEAISHGQQAAIVEEERPEVFTMRVGNIPVGEQAKVRLTLTGPLAVDDTEATWRFPLVVAPHYIPGKPLLVASCGAGTEPDTDAVPDASRISPPVLMPDYPNPVQFGLEIELHPNGLAVAKPRVSLHSVVTRQSGENAFHIQANPGQKLDCDFILRFDIAKDDVQTLLTVTPDATGDAGTYSLTIVPASEQPSLQKQMPRDIVFLIDCSGSMDGWKIVAARRALGRIVDTLSPADRFTVLAFNDRVATPPKCANEFLDGTAEHRSSVQTFLMNLQADGGTEMAAPLQQAVTLLSNSTSQRDRILVLITDGQVGNEPQIISMLNGQLTGIRIMTLGIDRAVNAAFLRQLAALGGGYSEIVESEERLDAVMEKVQRRLGRPILSELKIDAKGWTMEESTQVPRRLPDLYGNTPITIAGRYRGKPGTALTVAAVDGARRPTSITGSAVISQNQVGTIAWAREQVRAMEDDYLSVDHVHKTDLEKQIVATSLRFDVLCRFTAWLAVDVQTSTDSNGVIKRVIQPVEYPFGWELDETALGDTGMRMCLRDTTGLMCHSLGTSFGTPTAVLRAGIKKLAGLSESPGFFMSVDGYRERARKLGENLPEVPTAFEIGMLATDLEELLDDLSSVGFAEAESKPLYDLLLKLRSAIGDWDQLADEARQVLLQFANSAPAKRAFWK